MDGEVKEIAGKPGEDLTLTATDAGELTLADPAAPDPQRPFPDLPEGMLCQCCKRPTNMAEVKEMHDTPYVFSFKNKPVMVICFECYMNGVFVAAKQAWRDGVG